MTEIGVTKHEITSHRDRESETTVVVKAAVHARLCTVYMKFI